MHGRWMSSVGVYEYDTFSLHFSCVFLRSIKRLHQFIAFSLFDIYQRFLFFYLLGLFVEELQGCMSSVMVEKD